MEVLKQLGIEPAVLLLQAIAFIILFLILRRFMFRPVLAIMAQRKEEIAEALTAGERAKEKLARIEEERSQVLAQAREQGRELVREAVKESEEVRQRLLGETREEAEEIRRRAMQVVELERDKAMIELRREAVDLALLAASRAVLRTLDEKIHRQVVEDFISSLEPATTGKQEQR